MSSDDASLSRDPQVEAMFAELGTTVVAVRSPLLNDPPPEALMHPEEASFVARASSGRTAEFATGRACARTALRILGVREPIVRVAPDRSPVWPRGTVGSITHAGGECIALAAIPGTARWHPGVDLEGLGRITVDIARLAFSERERAWLPGDGGALDTAAFAMKEALYKAQHPITAEWVGFHDVEIDAPTSDRGDPVGAMTLRPARDMSTLDRIVWPVEGRWEIRRDAGDMVVAALVARPSG